MSLQPAFPLLILFGLGFKVIKDHRNKGNCEQPLCIMSARMKRFGAPTGNRTTVSCSKSIRRRMRWLQWDRRSTKSTLEWKLYRRVFYLLIPQNEICLLILPHPLIWQSHWSVHSFQEFSPPYHLSYRRHVTWPLKLHAALKRHRIWNWKIVIKVKNR